VSLGGTLGSRAAGRPGPRAGALGAGLVLCAGLLLAGPEPGWAARPLAGPWQQVLLRQRYRLSSAWNDEYCPPRPAQRSSRRPVAVELTGDGGRYSLRGGRHLRSGSHACISKNPAVKFTGYDAAQRTTRCSTSPQEATREEETHRLVQIDDEHIELRAQFHYLVVLKGHTCEAWMTEVRRFERAPLPAAPPPEVATPPPAPDAGPATPVEVAAAEPPADTPATAGVDPQGRRRRSSEGGLELRLQGAKDERGGVASTKGAEELRRYGEVAGGRGPVGYLLALALGLLALAAGTGGLVWLLRGSGRGAPRRPPSQGPGGADPEEHESVQPADAGPPEPGLGDAERAATVVDSPPPVPEPPGAAQPERQECPDCGRSLPPEARFCPFDGADLLPPPPEPAACKVCPVCGATYGPRESFCGRDGAPLIRPPGGVVPASES